MGIFAGSYTRRRRVISIRGPPGLQGLRRLKGDTGPQSPKCDKDDKGDLGYDGKTAMATESIMAHCKIIHFTTRIDDNDALNKSYVDTQTNSIEQNYKGLLRVNNN